MTGSIAQYLVFIAYLSKMGVRGCAPSSNRFRPPRVVLCYCPSMLASLADDILCWTNRHSADGSFYPTHIEDLRFVRADSVVEPVHRVFGPSICIIAQGAKHVANGEAVLDYTEGEYLVVGLDVPLTGRIVRATPAEPYLALALALDPAVLLEVAHDTDMAAAPASEAGAGVFVGQLEGAALDALERLVGLLNTPDAILALYPAITRELYYWLMRGSDGVAFAQLALPNGYTRRIADAVREMQEAFPGPVRVEDLAEAARMSLSSFYVHFKASTAMTPLQYYKRLRLLEARRLLIAEGISAQDAAYQVGYESPSQFSREYARVFGYPPGEDAERARTKGA